jgi:signal transduction histidine kinase
LEITQRDCGMGKIMVVEDEVVPATELEALLISMGHEVVGVASSGKQAIEMALNLRPDLILMDIVLPGELDGIMAAEKIMSDKDIPVVFVTGFSNKGLLERAKRLKPSGYILKPFQAAQIDAAVDIALHKKGVEGALLESEEKLRQLSSHLMESQERERRRISLELHDELGQALTVLKLKLGAMDRKLPEDHLELKEYLEDLRQYVDQIIGSVRRLSHDLTPSIVEDLGLSAALGRLSEDLTEHIDIETKIDVAEVDHLFSLEERINIYRIFQEALTNVAKHAQASSVAILVKELKDTLTLAVEDDGKGFEVEEIKGRNLSQRGLGLTAMEERVKLLGGKMEIWSKKGKGTRLIFSVPVRG